MRENKLQAYQSEVRVEEIGFTNYERLDEQELFDIIMQKLKKCPNIEVGEKQLCPCEDLYNCKIDGHEFSLIYDLVEGAWIYAKDSITRKLIITEFNGEE